MMSLLFAVFACLGILAQAVTAVFAALSHFAFEIGRGPAAALAIFLGVSLAISAVLLLQGRPVVALTVAMVCTLINGFIASKCP